MDSLIAAAGQALAVGDVLGALKRIGLRDDPSARALRGIAMAQLGEHQRARELLRQALRDFGSREPLARARCVVADAEVALAMRDLGGSWPPRDLAMAAATLAAGGDRANALHANLISVRRLLLLGRLDDAATALTGLDTRALPPSLLAVAELAAAELALRSLHTAPAENALKRAYQAAERSHIPALLAEVIDARAAFDRPAARRTDGGRAQLLPLRDVESLFASSALVVDACRHGLRAGSVWLPLASRPLLFLLLRVLARAWPGDVAREDLIEHAFLTPHPDDTHRARLRVEIGRLRRLIMPLATIGSTRRGYALQAARAHEVAIIEPPFDGDQASLLALLGDGAAWSTSALALALGASQRTVQRALLELGAAGRVRSIGRARAQRWLAPPITGFATNLLLPALLPT